MAIALLASAGLHSGVGFVAGTMGIGMSPGDSATRGGQSDAGADPGLLVWTDPSESPSESTPPQSDSAPESPSAATLVAVSPKEPEAAQTPPELRLGLAKSPHITKNWLGDVVPTPHSGLPSSVDQPELSLNPGAPGSPMARQGDTASAPENAPAMMPDQPRAASKQPPAAQTSASNSPDLPDGPITPPVPDADRPGKDDVTREGSSTTGAPSATDAMDRPGAEQGDPDADRDQIARLGASESLSGKAPASLNKITPDTIPDIGPGDSDDWESIFAVAIAGVSAGSPDGDPAIKETALVQKRTAPSEARPAPLAAPKVPNDPATLLPISPRAPASSPMGVTGPVGSGGSSPGQQSERESDASAIDPDPEIRPGMPWAGQGLEVFTRRIELSLFSRSTRAFRSPLLKVTFDRAGNVTNIEVLESSGSPDVDDSTRNSVYKWTARGDQLEELAPGAGLSMNFRILLRGR